MLFEERFLKISSQIYFHPKKQQKIQSFKNKSRSYSLYFQIKKCDPMKTVWSFWKPFSFCGSFFLSEMVKS